MSKSSANDISLHQPNENENENENEISAAYFPPPRTPLTAIPDPSQLPTPSHLDSIDKTHPYQSYATPSRTLSVRHGRPLSDPNSPARATSKPASARSTPFAKGKHLQTSAHTLSRGIPIHHSHSYFPSHFDLPEDPSFWADHNVQVLIRIRPLNSMETVSQVYGRCLKQETSQTLVWLGHPETKFTFDHIACEIVSQEKLFRVVGLPMVENCMSGYNSCMFAYGQTGSGKTYTMMGEINQLEDKLNDDSGITPRIFECLFSRIRMEEENRRNEKLRFGCKCSFLEIYNEQITDLLEPSSTNLQLREDSRKGVYVENLTEYNVTTVNDVTKLLSQGAANRKMAATNMNSESSRSHSVFTCIIESRWEKDSMTHFRFARLNLVDLAGSERQKHSGAEGDRLKEAANINKSLSTLGLVIMSLVDLAHGKHRHVPYRDSRLTFLLQDSLGGNSKTTIIANVSPSMCSAHETLSTLKFAQRAKLIQNNAKVNEDASGDVNTLQLQIQQLKDQLSFIMKHHNLPASLSSCVTNFKESSSASFPQVTNSLKEKTSADNNLNGIAYEKMKSMEGTVLGALRREKIAEKEFQRLEARFEHVNRFACQREEELQQTKLILRLREARIKHLEFLAEGSLPSDHFLMGENKALKEEIQLLQGRIDKNPELTRFALENLRLLEQLQVFHHFYEQGEREALLAETSELRDQLLDVLERKLDFSRNDNQDHGILEELEECRSMNSKLMREVEDLKAELEKSSSHTRASFDNVTNSFLGDSEEIRHSEEARGSACKSSPNKYSWVESVSTERDFGDEMASNSMAVDVGLKNKNNQKTSASVIQPIDTRLLLIQKQDGQRMDILNKDEEVRESMFDVGSNCISSVEKQIKGLEVEGIEEINTIELQAKLGKLIKDLEHAKLLNCKYRENQTSQLLQQHQVELIHEQVETETAKTIIHLQEEVTALQLELDEKFCCMTRENMKLRNIIEAKEEEIRMLCREWERATFELTSFLVEGSKSLEDASGQIESIVSSFPQVNIWVREHVETAARACIYKEEAILRLEKSLEDAQKTVTEMELKLNSLNKATIAFSEFPEPDNDQRMKETINLSMLLNEKIDTIKLLESQLKCKADQLLEAEKCADVALVVVKWLSDCKNLSPSTGIGKDTRISEPVSPTVQDIQALFGLENFIMEAESAISASFTDVEVQITALQRVITEASATYMNCLKVMVNEIQEMRSKFIELKMNYMSFPSSIIQFQASESLTFQHLENQHILESIRNELAKVNDRLKIIEDHFSQKLNSHGYPLMDEYLAEADNWSSDNSLSSHSTSCSDFSIENNQLDGLSHTCCSKFLGKIAEHMVDLKLQNCSSAETGSEGLKKLLKKLQQDEEMPFCLRKEMDLAFDAFNKLYAHLTPIIDEYNNVDISYPGGIYKSVGSRMETAEPSVCNNQEVVSKNKVNHHVHASTFLCKYEEARATMNEADIMVNALLKANENARELNCKWRQACEQLMAERSQLSEENEQLKATIKWKDEETKSQLDKVHHCLIEVQKYTSQFEVCFLQMQREADNGYKALCSDLLCMGEEMLQFVCNSRTSLEDIFSEMMKKELAHSVMYQCVIGEVLHTIPSFNVENHLSGQQKCYMVMNASEKVKDNEDIVFVGEKVAGEKELVKDLKDGELGISYDTVIYENLSLKKELERKETLLKGLHFDFSLLQETASKRKDIKDETEQLILALSEVRHELEMKTSQFDSLLVQYQKVEGYLVDTKEALCISNRDLSRAKERIDTLLDQNANLRKLLKDLYLKLSEADEQLKEQKEAVRGLEEETIHLSSSVESKIRSSVESLEEDLRKAANEREQLREEICSLNDKLDIAHALADENEAVAVECRQESKASKLYAEQKEEEVKILEHSVEELESTINVLETKVYEMNDEVETNRLSRESLELELQALRQRLLTVENFTDIMDPENTVSLQNEDRISRQFHHKLLELHEAHNRIRLLEQSGAEKDEEIKKFKEYISELVLHSEAQASQYQNKYKSLEAMVQEVKTKISSSASSAVPTLDKSEKSSMRTRGSSSPFRCISNLVQQMNLERDQELSVARLRVEELEATLAIQQKEICKLNARLAAAESMTHDVIRDLLGVKLDMTNYANLIDQHQVQRLLEAAHLQSEEFVAMEHEILNLKRQISNLVKEKESCVSEINKKAADLLAGEMTVEQLEERDQWLSAQNEMLKMDKTNLLKKVAELDDMVKTLLPTQNSQQIRRTSKIKDNGRLKTGDASISTRLAHSEKLLCRISNELARYRNSSN